MNQKNFYKSFQLRSEQKEFCEKEQSTNTFIMENLNNYKQKNAIKNE